MEQRISVQGSLLMRMKYLFVYKHAQLNNVCLKLLLYISSSLKF